MDIEFKGIGNANYQDISNFEKDEKKAKNFGEVFDKAIENKDEKELKKACAEFESYFLDMMFKSMRSTIVPGFKKSNAEKMFQEMLDQEMTKKIANSGGIGFSDMMFKQLSKNIE